MIDPSLEELEKSEARFLEAHGWKPVPKPRGAENNPEVPQWWRDQFAEEGEMKEYRQDTAVELQKARLVDLMRSER
jgi:hypothetical protein